MLRFLRFLTRRPVGFQAIIQLAFADYGRMHMIIGSLTSGDEYAASVGYVKNYFTVTPLGRETFEASTLAGSSMLSTMVDVGPSEKVSTLFITMPCQM